MVGISSRVAAAPTVRMTLGVTVTSFLLAYAALALTREAGSVPSIWPLNAIVLVVLLRTPKGGWWQLLLAMILGNVAASVITGDDIARAALLPLANAIETLIAATYLKRRFPLRLAKGSGVIRFVSVSVLACAVSTALAFMTLSMLANDRPLETSGLWFAADWLGLAIFAPLASVIADSGVAGVVDRKRFGKSILILVALVAVIVASFWQTQYPLLFLAPVMMALVAFQLGLGGAALACVIVAAIAVPLTFAGHGPIALIQADTTARVLVLQAFLGSTTLMSLVVGAAVLDRRKLLHRLTRSTDEARARAAREHTLLDQAQLAEQMSNVGYWTLTPATGEVFWSAEVYRIHGVSPETFDPNLGDALAFYPDEDRAMVAVLIAQGITDGVGWSFDAVINRRSDGEPREVRSLASCKTDPSGAVIKIFGVFKDMTDERRTINAVVENERRYRLLADNASDMIASFRPSGEITYISPASQAILGYSPEEMLGRKVPDMTHLDDRPGMLDHYKTLFEKGPGGVSPPYQFRGRHRDGRWVWLEGQPKVFFDEATGHPVEIHDVVRDVTARKELELALAKSQQDAEAATAAKATFLATMSHEIRTPLNGVLGFAELLDGTDMDDDQHLYVRRIRAAGRGLSALIDDILDFSRIEAGKLSIHDHDFDLRELTREVAALVESGMARKPIRFSVDVADEIPATIRGDDTRVRQVLLNLAGNAAKFTETGSIRLHAALKGGWLEIRVTDTGPGIDPEHMAGLFEGFTQVDGSITRRFGGSGLGLSISQSLATLMQGSLVIESKVGVGTTAILTVPYSPSTDPAGSGAPQALPSLAPARSSLHVMIVDDGAINRELVEIALRNAGHTSVSFEDAPSAIAALKTGSVFDAVLMDVQMPDMDGLAATRAIRKLDQVAADLPIVALTANVLPDQISACRDAGMDEHVAKPVELTALLGVLDRVSTRKAGLSALPIAPIAPTAPSALDDLTRRYVEHLAGLSGEIDRLILVGGPEDLARAAHSVAGTAGSFGFPGVSSAAFALEAAARRGSRTKRLKAELMTAVQAFKATIDEAVGPAAALLDERGEKRPLSVQ